MKHLAAHLSSKLHIPEPRHSGRRRRWSGGRRRGAGMMRWSKPGRQSPPVDRQSSRSTSSTQFSPGSYAEKRKPPNQSVQVWYGKKQNSKKRGTRLRRCSLCSADVGLGHVALRHGFHLSDGGVDHLGRGRRKRKTFSQSVDPGAFLAAPVHAVITSPAESACAMV